jgi:hypothetical protein
MTKRDFTAKTYNTLLEKITAQEKKYELYVYSPAPYIHELVHDLLISDDISTYAGNIDKYLESIVDKNNSAKADVDRIWENVDAADADHASRITAVCEEATRLEELFAAHTDTVSPSPAAGGLMPFCLGNAAYNAHVGGVSALAQGWHDAYVTREVERLNDLYLQEAALALLDTVGCTEAQWAQMSLAEKKIMIEKLVVELNAVMGTNISTVVAYGKLSSNVVGHYSRVNNQMSVNIDYLTADGKGIQVLRMVIHEVRHAYQYEATSGQGVHLVCEETLNQWRWNFTPGNYDDSTNGYQGYAAQPIEYDAKMFSGGEDELEGITPVYGGSWQQ